jgi:hypothetical protein
MGKFITDINDKPVRLTDPKALRLVKERAIREQRSAANAAAATIIEALSTQSNRPKKSNL